MGRRATVSRRVPGLRRWWNGGPRRRGGRGGTRRDMSRKGAWLFPSTTMSIVPPQYKDLSKASNDLLGKDYPVGTQLEIKTKAPNNVAFKVAGARDDKSGAIAGDLEGKYFDPKNGVTLTQTWTTTNVLKTQLELENQIAKGPSVPLLRSPPLTRAGLKFDLVAHLLPATQAKSAFVTAIFKQPSLHTRAHLDVFKGPTFTADAVRFLACRAQLTSPGRRT